VEVLTMKKREQLEEMQVLKIKAYTTAIKEMLDGTIEWNAAILNGARQTCKDNDIISLTEQGTPLGNLTEALLPFAEDDETKQAAQQS
jgi:hypothetical protein